MAKVHKKHGHCWVKLKHKNSKGMSIRTVKCPKRK